jgi:hypothetical protein
MRCQAKKGFFQYRYKIVIIEHLFEQIPLSTSRVKCQGFRGVMLVTPFRGWELNNPKVI